MAECLSVKAAHPIRPPVLLQSTTSTRLARSPRASGARAISVSTPSRYNENRTDRRAQPAKWGGARDAAGLELVAAVDGLWQAAGAGLLEPAPANDPNPLHDRHPT